MNLIDSLKQTGRFAPLDLHFAELMMRLNGGGPPEVGLAAALASGSRREGHICLDLAGVARRPVAAAQDSPRCPAITKWRKILNSSGVVGEPGAFRPLILDDHDRLYLRRYWAYQDRLAEALLTRADKTRKRPKGLTGLLNGHFGTLKKGVPPDRQRTAAKVALTRRFCVISGGPGTGKTYVMAKILALLFQISDIPPTVALAAPTGKAAARMGEAVRAEAEKGSFSGFDGELPDPSTIHRLLGAVPGRSDFRHNAENPLAADVVVVDEASMVDLALMSKLVQALRPEARLILLGDKDQLASVEAGAVLGDICDTGRLDVADLDGEGDGIRGAIVGLTESRRFLDDAGIGSVSRAINQGDADGALFRMKDGDDEIAWTGPPTLAAPPSAFREAVIEGFRGYLSALDRPEEIFAWFARFRVLCALRQGPFGAPAVNRTIEGLLAGAGLLRPEKTWYPGRPVLITRNDYGLKLFNGDVGIALADPEADGGIRVFFPGADGALRRLHPLRVPAHETVFAMTVHKSQGSEFDRVLFLMPDRDAPVLTRELIYTAVTRAKGKVEIWSDEAVFRAAVGRRIERSSGLRDALWGA